MEPEATTLEDRLARLEGQYHALGKELADNFKSIHDTLADVGSKLDQMHIVKRGMLKKETLAEAVARIDGRLDEVGKQIEAIAKELRPGR